MKFHSLFLLLTGIVLSVNIHAQSDPVMEKIVEIGQTDNRTMEHLDILCNRFGGRLIGSDAYEQSANWAAGKFREWGMEVVMDEAGAIPVGFNRGPWFGRILGEEGMQLHFATPSYTSGTRGVQRGHVLIEPKTRAQFNRMKGKLKGAWVLVAGTNNGFPIDISAEADSLRDSLKIVNMEIDKRNMAARRKYWSEHRSDAPGEILESYSDEPAVFYREMVEAGVLGFIQSSGVPIRALADRTNVWDWTFESLPTVPDIKLDEHQYDLIYRMAEERRYFQLEFDIRNHFRLGPIKYHSVIGIIPGTEFPDEYVLMSGHLDAYDVATGGVDDGSGVSPTMEAARLIMEAGGKPKRTILVVLWAGEEFGLLGSSSWVVRNADKLENISNMVNKDGGPEVPVALSVSAAMMEDFEPIVEVINTINPDFPVELKERAPRPRPAMAWGTDSGPFAVKGVPTISFEEGDPKGYDFSYFEIWHTERDTYNKAIPEYNEQSATATAVLVYGLANLDHKLSREGYYIEKKGKKKRN
ncbi:MAG: M28 family peptidase [Bacteroidota bacterium]|nr:M28 family peptidase [Bacteroidota bacterium]